jgi:hypothetical protein
MKRTSLVLVLALALVAGACGEEEETPVSGQACQQRIDSSEFNKPVPDDAEAYGLVVNSDLAVGPNRLLIGLLDGNDAPIGSPEMTVSMDIYDICKSETESVTSTDTEFIWTIEPVQGVYVGGAEFGAPGTYGAELTIKGDGIDETVKTRFDVKPQSSTPAIGAPAPTTDSKTAEDVKNLDEITTDPKPDPAFYEMSIADAVGAEEPFVLVFSTPKFCTSAVCGPTLDIVKGVAPEHPDVNFLHVEVYELPADPNNLQTVQAVQEWGLPSEPWVFVVGGDGAVAAKFEGGVGAEELNRTLSEV